MAGCTRGSKRFGATNWKGKTMAHTRTCITNWMRKNHKRFQDECGDVNCTLMVETWDVEEGSGSDTLDSFHPAWECAVVVAESVSV